jgi:hypothetical protein
MKWYEGFHAPSEFSRGSLSLKLISVFMRKFEVEAAVSFHVIGEEFWV